MYDDGAAWACLTWLCFTATGFAAAEPSAPGAYGVAGVAIAQGVAEPAAAGGYAVGGVAATFPMVWNVAGASAAWTLTPPTSWTLTRTGDDHDFRLGGVGHFLEALAEQRRLAAITRRTPAPVERFSAPAFRSLAPPASLMASPQPAALRAVLARQQLVQARAQAAIAARRRQEAELLMLVA